MKKDKDLVSLLLADHQGAKKLLDRIDTSTDLQELFCEIVQTVVVHEVAEEEIVYPAFRRIGGTDQIAQERIAEQQEAEELLAKMEHMDAKSDDFKRGLTKLHKAALDHAKREEVEVFPRLVDSLDEHELEQLGAAYETAKKAAPTHPHPHAPNSPPGNFVVGPVLALVDRVRDAAQSALDRAKA